MGDRALMAHQTKVLTADDLFNMPDDGFKYELVAGQLVRMSPGGPLHGAVGLRLGAAIGDHVDRHRLGVAVGLDTGFVLARDPDTVRGPDVAFISRARIPAEGIPVKFFPGAPDLAVEVLSPGNPRSEIDRKIEDYLRYGVRMVWFVDPGRRRAAVYRPNASPVTLSERDALDGGDVLPGFSYPLARLFTFDL